VIGVARDTEHKNTRPDTNVAKKICVNRTILSSSFTTISPRSVLGNSDHRCDKLVILIFLVK
jgi:hypothetical protein